MYQLPAHLQAHIYEYDPTYRETFNVVLLELEMYIEFDDRWECILDTLRIERMLFDFYAEGEINVLLLCEPSALYNAKKYVASL
tara:strand:+ start:83 stop:334 length:252 start_codon:yes stop_codon:yes gene_type:complete